MESSKQEEPNNDSPGHVKTSDFRPWKLNVVNVSD